MEANRKNAEKVKERKKSNPQTAWHTVLESSQVTENNIDFRANNNLNLNWEL